MPVFRIASFANGADVVTTIVDGRVLMQDRKVQTLDEQDVMERAQAAADLMLDRSGLRALLDPPGALWGVAHATSRLPQ
jgi:cytosine/adenosine deaminase-related metal-dependent hydrolase